MKLLAIEKESESYRDKVKNLNNLEDLLKAEARHVYNLYLLGSLREIYFTENKNAILVMETEDKKTAVQLLGTLPLVKSGKIKFEIMELRPYSGFERIIN